MDRKIKKALADIQEANYSGYFQGMDTIIPEIFETEYRNLKGQFISGNYEWDFYKTLQVFTERVVYFLETGIVRHTVKLEDVKKAQDYLDWLNSLDLGGVELSYNGEVVGLDKSILGKIVSNSKISNVAILLGRLSDINKYEGGSL